MQVEEKCCDYELYCEDKPKHEAKQNLELRRVINKIAKEEGFITYDVIYKDITPDGGNYLGVLTDVTIQGATADGKNELNLFVKSIIPAKDCITMISVPDVYVKEMYVYAELSKIYERMQEKAKIPPNERYNFVKCYEGSNSEFIIMENMVKKGFTSTNRFEVISQKYAKLSIQKLAKFHALSFVLEKNNPKYFEQHLKGIPYPIDFNEDWSGFFNNMCDSALDYLEGNHRSRLEKFIPNTKDKFKHYVLDKNTVRCLCHGDFRSNNILMKETDGQIEDVLPVDYQIIHYGSPFYDLFYFIYGATDKEFRQKHLTNIKNMYFDTMAHFLRYFDMNIEDVFPRKEFETIFKERLDFGLVTSIWYLPFNLADEDEIIDLGKNNFSDISFRKKEKVKKRLQGTVEEFIELGFL